MFWHMLFIFDATEMLYRSNPLKKLSQIYSIYKPVTAGVMEKTTCFTVEI